MREPETAKSARLALGAELAACRQEAGLSQAELAPLTGYSRSTIANVETGRQHVPRDFWKRADSALHAGGRLVVAFDELESMVRRERARALRLARTVPVPSRSRAASPRSPGRAEVSPTEPVIGGVDVIAAVADQAQEHAKAVTLTDVGPGTLERLRSEVIGLGRAYVAGEPAPLFAAMHQALNRTQSALDRRVYPGQAGELTFLAGALCGLMANASLDLGREDAAGELARAAWMYGSVVGHGPLMGWARGTQALAAIWEGRYAAAAAHAEEGLAHIGTGTGAVRLHAIRARALALHRDYAEARTAIRAAVTSAASQRPDPLHDGIGGEFAFDEAKLRYYHSLVLVSSERPAEAESAASAAISLYERAPDRDRSYGCEALARVQLAAALLMTRKVDEAAETFDGLLRLTPGRRISSLAQHLESSRAILNGPAFRRSTSARQLEQRLAAFEAASMPPALPSG